MENWRYYRLSLIFFFNIVFFFSFNVLINEMESNPHKRKKKKVNERLQKM